MPTISNFGGIVPRVPWHLLREEQATVAHDVKLRNGKIEAWRERLPIAMVTQDAKSFYYKGCCALSWKECVTVAEYVTDYGRLFLTGTGGQAGDDDTQGLHSDLLLPWRPRADRAADRGCHTDGWTGLFRPVICVHVCEYFR